MLLFDSSRHGGSGYDLARILRATHQRPFVGQSLSAAAFVKPKGGEWTFVDRTKPLPKKIDFFLAEPFTAADIAELVTRYDSGEGGPPPGWTGWFSEPEELDPWPGLTPPLDPEEFAWILEAIVEDMRSRLTLRTSLRGFP